MHTTHVLTIVSSVFSTEDTCADHAGCIAACLCVCVPFVCRVCNVSNMQSLIKVTY